MQFHPCTVVYFHPKASLNTLTYLVKCFGVMSQFILSSIKRGVQIQKGTHMFGIVVDLP